ncbi:MAG: hypothetical protein HY371_06135 [Devosia nanyangense]|jgi:hypothetical protein|uniref:Uncharacterized protein n=1 Tax=Paradevosia shaoguanensis TaxID=1335043 RepID=A0AA41QN04_9HYPH|nr:hypothetical protein [Paradevosia shaoguanensis]MBI4046378.1 hypothetical protein [Devosia nanyangense]MCF1742660.1 hypothetical protein [Paradevosia shaoguanensis]MCI0127143.1 hypothetical protein [Paradevosia shaoguanensis]QMV01973.1 hypothetical protein GHV40_11015 [Devosia sp. D6-9]
MKKSISFATGAVVILGMATFPAIAQDAPAAQPQAEGQAPAVTAPTQVEESYARVLDAIKAGAAVADISGSSGADVTVVQLSALQGDTEHDGAEVDTAITENQAAVAELRTAVAANAALTAKLQEVGVTPDQVVAVAKNDDGSLRVYVDDRKK